MKKINKMTIATLGIISLLGGLSSCSDPANDKVTIYFWHTFGDDLETRMDSTIEKFKKIIKDNEGVDIEVKFDYQGGYTDIEEKINKGFSTGNLPTIAVAYPDHVADYLSSETADGQHVVNLEQCIDDENYGFGKNPYLSDQKGTDDIVDSFYEEGSMYAKDGVYSFPFLKSTEVMFYNQTYMSKLTSIYNDAHPTTPITSISNYLNSLDWDGFMDLCQLAEDNKAVFGNSDSFVPAIYDSDSNLFISQTIQSGQEFLAFDENNNGLLAFNNDTVKSMVTSLKANMDDGLISTKGVLGTYGSTIFKEGNSIFSIGSTGGASYNNPNGGSFEVGISRVPPRNNNPQYVTQGPTLTILNSTAENNDKRIEYAWKLLKYITSPEVNTLIALSSAGYIPIRESSYATDLYQNYLEQDEFVPATAKMVIDEINGHYFNTPVFKGSAVARTACGAIITEVFKNTKSVDQSFEDARSLIVRSM